MNEFNRHPASFRDPSGFIFSFEGKIYRQVNQAYAINYELFKKSGLYDALVSAKQILPHEESDQNITGAPTWYKTLLPQQLSFIGFPYEWCFSQWKDAALLTLNLVKKAMAHGMMLKDATPFNIQFVEGGPVFIDSLSFEQYDETKPWIAYRQFVECFVAPLILTHYNGAAMLKMFQLYPNGLPLSLVKSLLPARSRLNLNVFLHVRLPVSVANKNEKESKQPVFNRQKMQRIISNLESFIGNLQLPVQKTAWNNYYEETILSDTYAAAKMDIVKQWMMKIPAQTILDLGANTGLFSLEAAAQGKQTIAADADVYCIEKLYAHCKKNKINNLLPMCIDLVNPSPPIGWNNEERASFFTRAKADIVLALALVHHLAISHYISFEQMADFLSKLSPFVIIEFVPKEDPKVQLLLREREDIFSNYTERFFIEAFSKQFSIVERTIVPGTARVLFLMKQGL